MYIVNHREGTFIVLKLFCHGMSCFYRISIGSSRNIQLHVTSVALTVIHFFTPFISMPSPHQLAKILTVYVESLMEFIKLFSPNGLNKTLLSQHCILEVASSIGGVGRTCIPRKGKR